MSGAATTHQSQAADGGSRHLSGVSFNGPLAVSLVAVSLVVIAVTVGAFAVVTSAFSGGLNDSEPSKVIDDLVAKHDAKTEEYKKRFEDRYIFYKPPPPPPPPRPPEPERPAPPPVPEDTGPKFPATYQGPSIAWVIGDDVYFNMIVATATEKYMRVSVGEERSGVKVISTEKMPRTIRVAHAGGEYDVKVFGETMKTSDLFPTSSRIMPLLPGLIPVGMPPVAPSTEPAETTADVGEADAAEDAGAAKVDATPANGERRRPDGRSRGPRGGAGRGGGPDSDRESGGQAPTPTPGDNGQSASKPAAARP